MDCHGRSSDPAVIALGVGGLELKSGSDARELDEVCDYRIQYFGLSLGI